MTGSHEVKSSILSVSTKNPNSSVRIFLLKNMFESYIIELIIKVGNKMKFELNDYHRNISDEDLIKRC